MVPDDFAPAEYSVMCAAQARAKKRAQARGLSADDTVFNAISQQVLDRLPLLLIEPTRVLDLGCRGPEQLAELGALYPESDLTGVSFIDLVDGSAKTGNKNGWFRRLLSKSKPSVGTIISGDPHHLPFDDGEFDLVVSNLCLPFCQSPRDVFAEVSRVLRPGGAFLFSSLGPDTLIEYRELWSSIDTYPHVSGLIDMHDLGDAMLSAGMADPVLDRDTLRLDYPSVKALEDELQVFGLVNMAHGRRRGLLSHRSVSHLSRQGARFTVGLELVHGHGWKSEFSPKRNSSNEEYRFPVSELQGSWKR